MAQAREHRGRQVGKCQPGSRCTATGSASHRPDRHRGRSIRKPGAAAASPAAWVRESGAAPSASAITAPSTTGGRAPARDAVSGERRPRPATATRALLGRRDQRAEAGRRDVRRAASRTPRGTRQAATTGAASAVPTCPSGHRSIASHMAGATAGAASALASSGPRLPCPKCCRDERRGAERRRAGDARWPRRAPPTTRAAPGRPGTRPASARMRHDRRELSCQPTSSMARGLRAQRRGAASSRACRRAAGRPASTATTPAAPITPARSIEGPPPASGT